MENILGWGVIVIAAWWFILYWGSEWYVARNRYKYDLERRLRWHS